MIYILNIYIYINYRLKYIIYANTCMMSNLNLYIFIYIYLNYILKYLISTSGYK